MLGRLAQKLLLVCVMCGLCAPASANTTANAATAAPADAAAPSSAIPATAPAVPAPSTAAPVRTTRIALLLPLRSETFGTAAQAVRAGFVAAHEREPQGIEISVLETADGPQNALLAYTDALPQFDMIVGPLARADVAAVAQSGKVGKPTVALAYPDAATEGEVTLPNNMLVVGLSIEEEARQVAQLAATGRRNAKAFVISTNIAWQRRAARAFANEWQQRGLDAQPIEINSSSGYISASSLVQLKKRLADEKPSLLFYALDTLQARQLQLALGRDNIVYGLSQLNPYSAADWRSTDRRPEMNGVRLVDLPWQLQPEHPAVMVYPRPVAAADQRANPDLDRLYALGIDAFRVAKEIAAQRSEFELDGVTGKLSVRFGRGTPRFSRSVVPAAYQDGIVVPIAR